MKSGVLIVSAFIAGVIAGWFASQGHSARFVLSGSNKPIIRMDTVTGMVWILDDSVNPLEVTTKYRWAPIRNPSH